MRIIVAPDSFKESLSAREVCAAIARGIRRVRPDAIVESIPMADGGEGTVDALVSATGGAFRQTTVTGPLGEPVTATWGLLGDSGAAGPRAGRSPREAREAPQQDQPVGKTAVIEMAAASGLALVPPDRRNPLLTTTYGTGELIRAALQAGAARLIVGIGGSATTDGGAGAAQAMGIQFLDAAGRPLPAPITGGQLDAIARIACMNQPEAQARVSILVACDVDNPLCGENGASYTFGPQKGATPSMQAELDAGLRNLARVMRLDLGADVLNVPGAGAAGGLGAGVLAFLGGTLRSGVDLLLDEAGFDALLEDADVVFTGEGRIDWQSARGKVPVGVARRARRKGVPCVALCGSMGNGAEAVYAEGVTAILTSVNRVGTLAEILSTCREDMRLVMDAAIRMLLVGRDASHTGADMVES